MSDWDSQSKDLAAITLFAEDLKGTKQFYLDVFNLPVHYEDDNSVVFRFGSTLINLLHITSAPELISPAVVAASDGGARFVFTIEVDDVDAVCEELTRRGVTLLNGPVDRWWGIRTASFTDPCGNIWEIAK
jgi:catechol 2,3-dioxygenase-like lactoylglutathione lyase family enzyme